MNAKTKKKLTKRRIAAIITAAVVCLLVSAVLILNVFIPVKYLTAWLVSSEERGEGVLTVTFLDVGYGDCTLCELPDGKILLIDGGDGSYANNLAVLRKLNTRGIDKIDYLVCTAVFGDYCGGLSEVMKYKEVGKIFMPAVNNSYITDSYYGFVSAVQESGAEIECCAYGNGAAEEEYFFVFLSPSQPENPNGYYAALNESATAENMRNASAVIWLEYAGTSFAFTSSAGAEALNSIVANYSLLAEAGDEYAAIGGNSVDLTECDVVSVAGHGSEECTSSGWYDLLKPSIAVVSVGDNYSDCPSAQALTDAGNVASATVLTSVHGDITFTVTRSGYTMT